MNLTVTHMSMPNSGKYQWQTSYSRPINGILVIVGL